MPCFTQAVVDGQILIDVLVTKPVDDDKIDESAPADHFQALVDTGASRSCITRKVAETIAVQPIDKQDVYTAGGKVSQNVYRVNMHIPVIYGQAKKSVLVQNLFRVDVFETAPTPSKRYDILLGMDVISHGSLHISGKYFTFCT